MKFTSDFLNPHKNLKEEFLNNLNSTSIVEIVALTVIMPAPTMPLQWKLLTFSSLIQVTILIMKHLGPPPMILKRARTLLSKACERSGKKKL